MDSVNKKLQAEKEKLLNFMLLIFALVGSAVIGISLLRAFDEGMNIALWTQAIGVLFLFVFALYRQLIPYSLKSAFLIIVPLSMGTAEFLAHGLLGGNVMLFITAVIIASVLAGFWYGVLTVFVSAIFMVCVAYLFLSQSIQLSVNPDNYVNSLAPWAVHIAAFVSLTLITGFLVGRISDIAFENMKLLDEQKQELLQANKTKDRLFQVIAHDLRSPFQGLISGLEFFAEEGDVFTEEQKQKLFQSMLRDSTSTFSMLENLLYWSKAQIGELEMDLKYVEVNKLVSDSVAPFERLAKQKNIDFTVSIEAGVLVFADERSVKIILSNLIHNAIKFTDRNGKVDISTLSQSAKTSIIVSDNGIGVPENERDALFDKQQYQSRRGTDNESGTGLGLNVSYELAKVNKGNLAFEENSSAGSSFILTLPASPVI